MCLSNAQIRTKKQTSENQAEREKQYVQQRVLNVAIIGFPRGFCILTINPTFFIWLYF